MGGSEEQNSGFPPKSPGPMVEVEEDEDRFEALVMDLDDLDGSWPLDQMSLFSDHNHENNDNNLPTSPLCLSCSDQAFSSLWDFLDGNDYATHATSAVPNCSGFQSGAPISIAERVNNDGKQRLSSPLIELVPLDNPDGYCAIKERMTQALHTFKDLTEQNVLAQVWVPIKNGSRYVLTTSGQPFVIGSHIKELHQYRMVSQMYMFPVDEETDGLTGLPGHVFRKRVPEWTPNVQFYSMLEYPRRNHAQNYNVHGSLALPVTEPSGQYCVAVLELIMTSAKINYAPEFDQVCKALETVNLKSFKILDCPNTQFALLQ